MGSGQFIGLQLLSKHQITARLILLKSVFKLHSIHDDHDTTPHTSSTLKT